MDDRRCKHFSCKWRSFPLHSWTNSSQCKGKLTKIVLNFIFEEEEWASCQFKYIIVLPRKSLWPRLWNNSLAFSLLNSRSLWSSQMAPIASIEVISSILFTSSRGEMNKLHVLCCRQLLRKRFLIWYNTTFNFNDYTLIRRRRKSQRGTKDKQVLAEGRIRAH